MKLKQKVLLVCSALIGTASLLAASFAMPSVAALANRPGMPHLYHWGFEDVKTKGAYFTEACSGEATYTSTDLGQELVDGPTEGDHAVQFSPREGTAYGSHFVLNPQNLGTSYKVTVTFNVSNNTAVQEQHVVSICAFDKNNAMQGGWRLLTNTSNKKIWFGYHKGTGTSTGNVNATYYYNFDTWYTATITVNGSNITAVLTEYGSDTKLINSSVSDMTINEGWTPSIQFAGGMRFNDDKTTTQTANFHAYFGKISDITIDSL